MRYSSEHKQETRRKILEAAGRLFRERGYNGVGVDAVMAEVGLTAGGFYAHFPSKEALFVEALGATFKQSGTRLADRMKKQTGLDWLQSLIFGYLSEVHRDLVTEGCPMPALTPDVTRSSAEAKRLYEHVVKEFLGQIEAQMPEGNPPARERAMGVLAQLIGGLMLARALDDLGFSNEVLEAVRNSALRTCIATSQTLDPRP
ncbi:MAG: TetR/AcrR family transcriptional regulator [Blastocatellia bacterium]|nr:TetR/AcrR family transcriptional regulator [Blastocatellia bacterium]